MKMARNWTRLVQYIAEEDGQIHLGDVDAKQYPDVGLAAMNGERITAKLINGSVFDGVVTGKCLHIAQLLSPVGIGDVSIIRCLGLNYRGHAKGANVPIPEVPVFFMKPLTALNGSHLAKINMPKIAQDGSSEYKAELSVILSKSGRDIPESEPVAMMLALARSSTKTVNGASLKDSTDLAPLDRRWHPQVPLKTRTSFRSGRYTTGMSFKNRILGK